MLASIYECNDKMAAVEDVLELVLQYSPLPKNIFVQSSTL
jgi:hypothetical protein